MVSQMNASRWLIAYLDTRLVTEVWLTEETEPVALADGAGSLWRKLAT